MCGWSNRQCLVCCVILASGSDTSAESDDMALSSETADDSSANSDDAATTELAAEPCNAAVTVNEDTSGKSRLHCSRL